MTDKTLVIWHEQTVQRPRGCVVWFTGLSGSGKSTIANCVDFKLDQLGVRSFLLDGDNVRHTLNASPEILKQRHGEEFARRFGLTFSADDREENIRRVSGVAEIFCTAGIVTLAAFVSPYRKDRDMARELVESAGGKGDFVEVFVDTPLEVCERRDPKGLYQKARSGQLKGFTGIDAPYEEPTNPEIVLAGGESSVEQLADEIVEWLKAHRKITISSQS